MSRGGHDSSDALQAMRRGVGGTVVGGKLLTWLLRGLDAAAAIVELLALRGSRTQRASNAALRHY